jgi:hypothetical protein
VSKNENVHMSAALALNVSAAMAHFRQLSEAFRKTYTRPELFTVLTGAVEKGFADGLNDDSC